MREILFRGKRVDNGEWVEGDLVQGIKKQAGMAFIWSESSAPFPLDVFEFKINPATLGQYTGLTDKNGKKIFGGDVVEQNWYDYNEPIAESFGVVVYCESNCSFSVMDANENRIVPLGSCHAYHWEAEVIGNIHDNPELMKGGTTDGDKADPV